MATGDKIRIHIGAGAYDSRVQINDVDITHMATGLNVSVVAGDLVRIGITLVDLEGGIDDIAGYLVGEKDINEFREWQDSRA